MSGTPRQPTGLAAQGMVTPGDSFVEADGTLTPISFRFLWGVYQEMVKLEAQVATLQQRLTNAGL